MKKKSIFCIGIGLLILLICGSVATISFVALDTGGGIDVGNPVCGGGTVVGNPIAFGAGGETTNGYANICGGGTVVGNPIAFDTGVETTNGCVNICGGTVTQTTNGFCA